MNLNQFVLIILSITLCQSAVGAYDFKKAGSDWTGLCSTGQQQSPIDIVTANAQFNSNRRIYIDWNQSTLFSQLTKKDFTVQQDGKWLTLNVMDDKGQIRVYEGAQFHFHTKSDHTIDGKYYDAELHIVCAETTESRAQNSGDQRTHVALGFLFNIGEANRFFKFIDYSKAGQTVSNNGEITFGDMVASKVLEMQNKGKTLHYYQYAGSLTTPACDEIVTHIVIDQVFSISKAQIDSFRNAFSGNSNWGAGNYRVIQKLNGRTVFKGEVINDHMLPRKSGGTEYKDKPYIVALFVVLFILVAVLIVISVMTHIKVNRLSKTRASSPKQQQYEQVKQNGNGLQNGNEA